MSIKEVIQNAIASGENPVQAVKDYMEEKDSFITWTEAERLVERHTAGGHA